MSISEKNRSFHVFNDVFPDWSRVLDGDFCVNFTRVVNIIYSLSYMVSDFWSPAMPTLHGSCTMIMTLDYPLDYGFSEKESLSLVVVTIWWFKLAPPLRKLSSLLPGIIKFSYALDPSSGLMKSMDPLHRMSFNA